MDKKELKEMCRAIADCFSSERLDNAVEQLLQRGCVDLDNADKKVLPSAIMAAFFEDVSNCCLKGNFNENVNKEIKKEYRKIKCCVPASW